MASQLASLLEDQKAYKDQVRSLLATTPARLPTRGILTYAPLML